MSDCGLPPAMASETILAALASARARRSLASASRNAASFLASAARMADCLSASAARMTACFSPSAFKISDWRIPSASSTLARLSRSAFICRAIELIRSAGGVMSLISTRVTLTPQGMVASSTTASSLWLMASRWDSSSSISMLPITVRMLVMIRFKMATFRSLT